MRATPWPRAANRGRFSFDSTKMHSAVGWAKAKALSFDKHNLSCAVPTVAFGYGGLAHSPAEAIAEAGAHACLVRLTLCDAWTRRTMDFATRHRGASAFAHPTISAFRQNENETTEVSDSHRGKEQASQFFPKRSCRSENTQELNDIMPIFRSAHASPHACKTGSHVASKCSRVAFIPGGCNFLRAGAGLATLDHRCCCTRGCDHGIVRESCRGCARLLHRRDGRALRRAAQRSHRFARLPSPHAERCRLACAPERLRLCRARDRMGDA